MQIGLTLGPTTAHVVVERGGHSARFATDFGKLVVGLDRSVELDGVLRAATAEVIGVTAKGELRVRAQLPTGVAVARAYTLEANVPCRDTVFDDSFAVLPSGDRITARETHAVLGFRHVEDGDVAAFVDPKQVDLALVARGMSRSRIAALTRPCGARREARALIVGWVDNAAIAFEEPELGVECATLCGGSGVGYPPPRSSDYVCERDAALMARAGGRVHRIGTLRAGAPFAVFDARSADPELATVLFAQLWASFPVGVARATLETVCRPLAPGERATPLPRLGSSASCAE